MDEAIGRLLVNGSKYSDVHKINPSHKEVVFYLPLEELTPAPKTGLEVDYQSSGGLIEFKLVITGYEATPEGATLTGAIL